MDIITVITLNANDEQIETVLTVNELIYAWQHDIDIPTNDDTVVSCVLSETQLYFETFGELMKALTGNDRRDGWFIWDFIYFGLIRIGRNVVIVPTIITSLLIWKIKHIRYIRMLFMDIIIQKILRLKRNQILKIT